MVLQHLYYVFLQNTHAVCTIISEKEHFLFQWSVLWFSDPHIFWFESFGRCSGLYGFQTNITENQRFFNTILESIYRSAALYVMRKYTRSRSVSAIVLTVAVCRLKTEELLLR